MASDELSHEGGGRPKTIALEIDSSTYEDMVEVLAKAKRKQIVRSHITLTDLMLEGLEARIGEIRRLSYDPEEERQQFLEQLRQIFVDDNAKLGDAGLRAAIYLRCKPRKGRPDLMTEARRKQIEQMSREELQALHWKLVVEGKREWPAALEGR